MQSIANGFGLPAASNLVLEEAYRPLSVPLALSDLPTVPTQIQLPAGTHGVVLYALLDSLWWALDENPGPIPAEPVQGMTITAAAFLPGGVLMGGTGQTIAVPNDFQLHVLYLVSLAPAAAVTVTLLTEYAA